VLRLAASNTGARARSRTLALLIVAAAHVVVLEMIWRAHSPAPEESEDFVMTALFIAPRPSHGPGQPKLTKGPGVGVAKQPRSSRSSALRAAMPEATSSAPDEATSAPAVPSTPGQNIDWGAQISTVADAVMAQDEVTQRQRSALMRKFVLAADPSDATARMPTRFRWSNIDADHDGTRNWMSTLHLDEHCVLVGFVIPECAIERIKTPSSDLEWQEQKHEATLVTPGPNSVPP
jgi:hypothetical protein